MGLVAVAILCGACAPDSRADLETLVERSNFLFRGTVVEAGATATPEVSATERTAVVELEEVFVGGDVLGEAPGTRITVELRRVGRPAEGATALFFATGWIFGRGVAVREVAHDLDVPDSPDLRERLEAARQALADQELAARIETSELVVSGRVLEIVDVPPRPEPYSEHQPGWVEARVQVERVLKGEEPSGPAVFLYPSSPDVMWRDAPKPTVGQTGIWLLHRDDRLEALTVSAPLDVQPIESLDRIAALSQRSPP